MSRAQISALVFGVGGFGALVASTTSNEWKVTTRASSVITATWVYQGLWMNCAGTALGSFHCRPHFTIFKVEVPGAGKSMIQALKIQCQVKVFLVSKMLTSSCVFTWQKERGGFYHSTKPIHEALYDLITSQEFASTEPVGLGITLPTYELGAHKHSHHSNALAHD